MIHLRPLLTAQTTMSALPKRGELLVEWTQYGEKWHLTIYPFAGRAVNEGIAALAVLRWSRLITTTFAYAANDFGFIIILPRQTLMDAVLVRELLSPDNLIEDLLACVNVDELSRRQFREIARIAGLLPPSPSGKKADGMRHLQTSAGLIYDVLQRFDPDHVLLAQARREVFEEQLDVREMSDALQRCAKREINLTSPLYLSPLTFPIWAECCRGEWSNEEWKTRVARAAQHHEFESD
jgi:ATP-dependent Lhr-like helicase